MKLDEGTGSEQAVWMVDAIHACLGLRARRVRVVDADGAGPEASFTVEFRAYEAFTVRVGRWADGALAAYIRWHGKRVYLPSGQRAWATASLHAFLADVADGIERRMVPEDLAARAWLGEGRRPDSELDPPVPAPGSETARLASLAFWHELVATFGDAVRDYAPIPCPEPVGPVFRFRFLAYDQVLAYVECDGKGDVRCWLGADTAGVPLTPWPSRWYRANDGAFARAVCERLEGRVPHGLLVHGGWAWPEEARFPRAVRFCWWRVRHGSARPDPERDAARSVASRPDPRLAREVSHMLEVLRARRVEGPWVVGEGSPLGPGTSLWRDSLGGYHCVYVEPARGTQGSFVDSDDSFDVLFEVADGIAHAQACEYEATHRVRGQDVRHVIFAEEERILARLGPRYAARCRERHDEVLARHPFDDARARAQARLDDEAV